MKHHPVFPLHESKTGSPLQQRARERNYDLFCLSGISQNLRRIIIRNSEVVGPRDPLQLEAKVKDLCNYIESRVKGSYDGFKREYTAKEVKRANQSPE